MGNRRITTKLISKVTKFVGPKGIEACVITSPTNRFLCYFDTIWGPIGGESRPSPITPEHLFKHCVLHWLILLDSFDRRISIDLFIAFDAFLDQSWNHV